MAEPTEPNRLKFSVRHSATLGRPGRPWVLLRVALADSIPLDINIIDDFATVNDAVTALKRASHTGGPR